MISKNYLAMTPPCPGLQLRSSYCSCGSPSGGSSWHEEASCSRSFPRATGIADAKDVVLGLRDGDFPRFEQGLQVGEDSRPAAGHGGDELGLRPVDLMGDGELHCAAHGIELDGAATRAFGLELGFPLVLPPDDHAPRLVDLEDLACVNHASVRADHFPRRALLPAALDGRAEPVLADELRVGQGLPQLLGRGADEGDVDEAAAICCAHGV